MIAIFSALPFLVKAQKDNNKIIGDSKEAKAAFIKADPSMEHLFMDCYGYAILPNVGKGELL